jgi:hypothetical protein
LKTEKPRRLIVGTQNPSLKPQIHEIGLNHGVETVFSTSQEEIIGSAKAVSPSIAVLDLSSTDYDPFECCHQLEWSHDITVVVFYPDPKENLPKSEDPSNRMLWEAYGVGFDVAIPVSFLIEALQPVVERRHDDLQKMAARWFKGYPTKPA